MKSSIASAGFVALGLAAGAACAEEGTAPEAVQQGHHLALVICAYCHLAASDQQDKPVLQPPAPPFATIAQRRDLSADFLRTFLATTHRDVDARRGMPNPELMDFQIKQVTAYLLSLRKSP